MNIDELKTVWQQYSQRAEQSIFLNEKIILGMIKDRSRSLLDKMKREYVFTFIYLALITVFCILCLIENAFDYTNLLSYIPLSAYTICLVAFLLLMIKGYTIVNVSLTNANLKEALEAISAARKKQRAMVGKVGLLIMCFGALFPFAHLPKVLATKGWTEAIGLGMLPLAAIVVVYFIAKKLGAFKDRYAGKLQENLNEMEEVEMHRSEL